MFVSFNNPLPNSSGTRGAFGAATAARRKQPRVVVSVPRRLPVVARLPWASDSPFGPFRLPCRLPAQFPTSVSAIVTRQSPWRAVVFRLLFGLVVTLVPVFCSGFLYKTLSTPSQIRHRPPTVSTTTNRLATLLKMLGPRAHTVHEINVIGE